MKIYAAYDSAGHRVQVIDAKSDDLAAVRAALEYFANKGPLNLPVTINDGAGPGKTYTVERPNDQEA